MQLPHRPRNYHDIAIPKIPESCSYAYGTALREGVPVRSSNHIHGSRQVG